MELYDNGISQQGNLGGECRCADPETRYMPNGDPVANVRLATTESWKDKASGEKRETHGVASVGVLSEVGGTRFVIRQEGHPAVCGRSHSDA